MHTHTHTLSLSLSLSLSHTHTHTGPCMLTYSPVAGRIMSAFYILLALPLFGNLIATLVALPLNRRRQWAETKVKTGLG